MSNFRDADIKLISMDFDDTLRQSYSTFSSLMIELGSFFKLDLNEQKIRSLWGKRPEELTREAFADLELSGVDSWNLWKIFVGKRPERLAMPLFEGIINSLSDLLNHDYHLGVVSNGSTNSIYECINSSFTEIFINGEHPFLFIHTKDNCIKPKPYPEAFNAAFEYVNNLGLDIQPENVVHIGDHIDDYHAAVAKGIYPALVTTGVISRSEFIAAGVDQDVIFSSFRGFANTLLEKVKTN